MEAVLAAAAAGATVVTANNRLARGIQHAYQRARLAAGETAWRTPQVLPWSAWIEQLWWSSLTSGGSAGRHVLLNDFQVRLLWQQLVSDALAVGGAALADLAARAWRLSVEWRIPPERLRQAADSDDTSAFAAWAAAFRERCEAAAHADGSTMLGLLAGDLQQGRLQPPREVHFVGFTERTPLQQELLRALAASGCLIRDEPPASDQDGDRDVCRVACTDTRAELEAAARWARHRVETGASEGIAVVIPDLAARIGTARRIFLDVFAPDWRLSPGSAAPVNFSYTGALCSSGLFHTALIVLRALTGELDRDDAGYLLRSPYLQGGESEAAGRARLDLHVREGIGTTVELRDLVELAGRACPGTPLLADSLGRLADIAARLPRRQASARWADLLRSALEAVGWPGERRLGSDEYQTAMACQGLGDDLRACDPFTGPLTLVGALGLLESLARERAFQPAGHPGAVQVLGALEALGQRFEAVWISGLTSTAWPPAPRPNPLLPLSLQRELAMPDSSPAIARERAERILRVLQASAPRVVASWAGFDGEEPLSASPLIAHLPERRITELELSNVRPRSITLLEARCTEWVAADPAPPVAAGAVLRGGAGLLEREARCPARAFLQYRLGARELAAAAPGIDPATRGSVVHAVLQAFFTRVTSQEQLQALSSGEQRGLLDSIIRTVLARHVPQGRPFLARLAANEAARLRTLIETFLDAERRRPPFQVLWTESLPTVDRPGGTPRALPPALIALGITLRPDRIDLLADGRMLVIDYKTGSRLPGARELWGPRPRAPQLPLYATLADAEGIAWVHLGAGPVRWLGIGHDAWDIEGISDPADFTGGAVADWGELRASWWTALERLGTEILDGCFTIDRWRRDDAGGQWAMATRVHELADEEAEECTA